MKWLALRQIKSSDPRDRAAAAAKLAGNADPKALAAIVEALNDADINVRRAATLALGEFGSLEAVGYLLRPLWDASLFVQYEAVAALAKIGGPAVQHLSAAMLGGEPQLRALITQIVSANPALAVQLNATGAVVGQNRPVESPSEDAAEVDDDNDGSEDVVSAGDRDPLGGLEQLRQQLQSPRKSEVIAAAKSLLRQPDPKAWEELVDADLRRNPRVLELTSKALSKLCRHGDVSALRPKVARCVLERLHEVPGDHSVGVFRRALRHINSGVRSLAERYIDELGVDPSDDDEKLIRAADRGDWGTVRKLGPGSLPELLIGQLTDGEMRDRVKAAESLGELQDGRGVMPLIESLKSPESMLRRAAAKSLGQLQDRSAVEPLCLRLRDSESGVRCACAEALGELLDFRAAEPLRAAARDLQKTVRRSAVRALARLDPAVAVKPLGEALGDSDVEVRRVAAAALATMSGADVIALLAGALDDEDDGVRTSAASGLANSTADDPQTHAARIFSLVAALRSAGRGARRAAAEGLTKLGWAPADTQQQALHYVAMENPLTAEDLGEDAVDALCVALVDGGHYYLCQTAAECLGRIMDLRAVPALCHALIESTDMTVRAAAATALGQIRGPGAMGHLAGALENEPEAWARPYLAAALASLQSVQGDRLVSALADREPKVRLRAAILLARKGDPRGSAQLDQIANESDVMLRGKAIRALGQDAGPDAIRRLLDRIAAGGYAGGNEAVDALVAMGDRAAAPMAAALAHMDHNACWLTLIGLARLEAAGMAALTSTMFDANKDLKKLTCEVLGRMYDRQDVKHKPTEPLIVLRDDPDAEIRRLANHALELLERKPQGDTGAV
jgi:HEAT repeat protein